MRCFSRSYMMSSGKSGEFVMIHVINCTCQTLALLRTIKTKKNTSPDRLLFHQEKVALFPTFTSSYLFSRVKCISTRWVQVKTTANPAAVCTKAHGHNVAQVSFSMFLQSEIKLCIFFVWQLKYLSMLDGFHSSRFWNVLWLYFFTIIRMLDKDPNS